MALWFALALMTAAAIFAVLWPLSQRVRVRGATEVAVYRDQLDEIARDRKTGLIGDAEAEAARIEVSRRLIAAATTDEAEQPVGGQSSLWRKRATALAGLMLVPACAVGLYLALGSPDLPGEPLAARLDQAHSPGSITAMISQVEAHLERNPNDVRGYEVLAPIYLRIGRFDQSVAAWRKVIAIAGDTAARESDLGEALTAAGNGVVTDDAKAAFEKAAKLDPTDPKAQFYRGMAAEQDGNKQTAIAIWSKMLKAAPAGAPWIDNVKAAIVRIGGTPPQVAASAPPPAVAAPGPNAAQVAAASQMSEQNRSAMIRGMVARLADKLKNDGNDVEGWQRLLRAYVVLGERDKALAAAGDARHALAGDPTKLRQIEDMIKSLGLNG